MRAVFKCDTVIGGQFPFLFGGTFIEGWIATTFKPLPKTFPFLFGGTFIEGNVLAFARGEVFTDFPSFSEGLSLRV